MKPICGAKTKKGGKCQHLVAKRGQRCDTHSTIAFERGVNQGMSEFKLQWRSEMIVPPGQWIDVRSETRPEVVHHVYTGDQVNTPHCSCENFRWASIEENVLLTCKHIDLVIFGKGAA